ncbi:MAG: FAD-binding oxidoreductase [Actinomycetota bacterium]
MTITASAKLTDGVINALRDSLRGEVITPQDASYDGARAVWNGSIDRRPALVIRCRGVHDVRTGLRFGRDQDLPIAVRAGGHNVAGFGTCDDGLVLDLRPMTGARVDPVARTVRTEPGLVWGELDRETQSFGLAVTGGVMSSTGVAGFTLGGGIGWLQRKLGLACDNLISADVLTSDDELVHASAEENGELFWALRGGGGNFGIVTSFEFALHRVGPEVFAGIVAWPAEDAAEVLAFYRDFITDASDDVTCIAICRTAPPAPFLPESIHGKPIAAVAGLFAGSVEDGEKAFAPLRSFGKPAGDAMGPKPYAAFNAMFDGSWAPGLQNYWKAEYLTGLPNGCVEALASLTTRHTSPLSDFKVAALGGAVARVGEDDTAYGHRSAPFILNINTRWADPSESDLHIEHTRAIWESAQAYADGGSYVNFMGEEGTDRIRAAYGDAKYRRLQTVKDRFDPDNVFRLNQNIKPSR